MEATHEISCDPNSAKGTHNNISDQLLLDGSPQEDYTDGPHQIFRTSVGGLCQLMSEIKTEPFEELECVLERQETWGASPSSFSFMSSAPSMDTESISGSDASGSEGVSGGIRPEKNLSGVTNGEGQSLKPILVDKAKSVKPVLKKKPQLKSPCLQDQEAQLPSILRQLEDVIPRLLTVNDFSTDVNNNDFFFLRDQARLHRKAACTVFNRFVELGGIEVCQRAFQQLFNANLSEPLAGQKFIALLILMWNGSDISIRMSNEMTQTSIPDMLFEYLAHPKLDLSDKPSKVEVVSQDLDDEHAKQLQKMQREARVYDLKVYTVKAIMGIAHNLLRKCEVRERFRNMGALAILQRFRKSAIGIPMVLCKTEILLAYIINEKENNIINSDAGNIKLMVDILSSAITSEGHHSRHHGYCAEEVVSALNKLAVNDTNKVSIIREGALKHYVALLACDCTQEEQVVAARGLWTLAFNEEVRSAIKEQRNCLEALHQLEANSPSQLVRKAATGALWILEDRENSVKSAPKDQSHTSHVMISYQWGHQSLAIRIKDKLKSAGYNVWMDVEDMSGSTLEAMAVAVEQAALVLICMSQKYKESPNCRTEAEYTFRLRKPFIPLKVQHRYNPDGWLGIMIGTKLWFDFGNEIDFEATARNLLRELKKQSQSIAQVDAVERQRTPICDTPAPPEHLHINHGTIVRWNRKDIACWLKDNGLTTLDQRLAEFDGSLILEYKHMMNDAPEAFYGSLRGDLDMSIIEILKFTKALRTLGC